MRPVWIGLWLASFAASGAASAQTAAAPPAPAALDGCQDRQALAGPTDKCEPKPAETPDAPDLGFLKTPASPAFAALGLSPTTIDRPTTPKGAAVTIASGLADAAGISPAENFAMELTPYWTFSHPDVTAEELLNEGVEALWRNASLSLAVVRGSSAGSMTSMMPTTSDGDAVDKRAAAGFRTTLWPGRPSDAALSCQKYLRVYLDGIVARMSAERVKFLADWEKQNPQVQLDASGEPKAADFPDTPEGRQALARAIEERHQAVKAQKDWRELVSWRRKRRLDLAAYMQAHATSVQPAEDPMVATCLERIHDRRGLMADLAIAGTATVPGGDLSKISSNGRHGMEGWLTGGWVSGTSSLGAAGTPSSWSLLASVHAQQETTQPNDVETSRLDLGGRGVWAWGRFGLSLEGIYRRQSETGTKSHRYRATIGFDFRVVGSTWINIVAGKDFGLKADEKPLLTLANLQWAFGPERKLLPDTAVSQ
jgi:hypothetical protein